MSRIHELLELRKVIAAYHVGLSGEFDAECKRLETLIAELKATHGYIATEESAKRLEAAAKKNADKMIAEATATLKNAQTFLENAEKKSKEIQTLEEKFNSEKITLRQNLDAGKLELGKIQSQVKELSAQHERLQASLDQREGELARREATIIAKEQALASRIALLQKPVEV